MNLANIPDSHCFAEKNVEAAIGTIVMKYAFDGEKLKKLGDKLVSLLYKMEVGARATLAEKIELYLGEFLDEDIVQELKMRMSIGQALGIVTAGDRRRAAERAGRRAGMKKGMEKGMEMERSRNEAVNAKRVEFLRSRKVPEALISAMLAIK